MTWNEEEIERMAADLMAACPDFTKEEAIREVTEMLDHYFFSIDILPARN